MALPPNYTPPAPRSDYMKFVEGNNKFRILSDIIVGWEYWTADKKPIRLKSFPQEMPSNIKVDPKKHWQASVKHFWGFAVWNYAAEEVQVLVVTQVTIHNAITALEKDPNWGDSKGYDITVTRVGEGMNSEYSVIPTPPKPISADIALEWKMKPAFLEQLFVSGDPFQKQTQYAEDEEVRGEVPFA